ncbi:MAG: SpoIID/LytB domain-containing protein [Paludibacteraceae bacterium]|nr:SpoIID/LytB domain-containing protein [Paludibacteraceae bacterium]
MGTASTIRVGIVTVPKIAWEQKENTFVIHNVRIGVGFHWDRLEDQEFAGTLTILHNADGTETAVNSIDIEDYLCSVISSEMSADSPMELLKAHAVISRSWVLRAIGHTEHVDYDVCADDHCQRYEGLRRMNMRAVQAVRETAGQVLTYAGEVCDCRYHKCCGGRTERYSTCWEDKDYPYLQSVACDACDTHDNHILSKVLTNYDQETHDFHDWQVRYTNAQLHDILYQKTGVDFGTIEDLVPLRRGDSGRISALQVTGSRCTQVLSKELAIRRALSGSCLYSSLFDVTKDEATGDFLLDGHGWGHGVGLCQIGAAVMAERGTAYTAILQHYYPHSRLEKR